MFSNSKRLAPLIYSFIFNFIHKNKSALYFEYENFEYEINFMNP
jgi:hypothetical protein